MNLELEDEDVRIALGDMRSGAQQKPEGNNAGFVFPTTTSTVTPTHSHSRNPPRSNTSHMPALSLSLASTHPSEPPPRTPPPDAEEHRGEKVQFEGRTVHLDAGSGERMDEFAGGVLDRESDFHHAILIGFGISVPVRHAEILWDPLG
ncbi:hypothetical protein C8J57DRAFT_1248362 [Mycena rebaudengoi]|nr:hypothetical protein C8J57DRAFT_1248362 [Mycena rebaudengoi]